MALLERWCEWLLGAATAGRIRDSLLGWDGLVYDSKRGVMVLTGGAGGDAPNAGEGGRCSDTWELWPSLFISGQPANVTNVVCGTAAFMTFSQGVAPLSYQWRLDGSPLAVK